MYQGDRSKSDVVTLFLRKNLNILFSFLQSHQALSSEALSEVEWRLPT